MVFNIIRYLKSELIYRYYEDKSYKNKVDEVKEFLSYFKVLNSWARLTANEKEFLENRPFVNSFILHILDNLRLIIVYLLKKVR